MADKAKKGDDDLEKKPVANNEEEHEEEEQEHEEEEEDSESKKKSKDDKKDDDDPLKPLKENLNKAYKERDKVKKELADFKKAQRDAELERMKAEGKEVEALTATVADKDAELESLRAQIIELTRDAEVRRELSHHAFKNERATELAYDAIVRDLEQNEDGDWVHKRSGKTVSEFIQSFVEDEDNEFLLKTPENRGTSKPKGSTPNKQDKTSGSSLLGKSNKEILASLRKKK